MIKKRYYLIFLVTLGLTVLGAAGARSQDNFEYLSSQPFSATEIKGVEAPSGCEAKEVGQFILVTDIPVGEAVYSAMSNQNQTWTKRGKLYEINEPPKEKIIEQFKSNGGKLEQIFGTADENEVKKRLVSGAYFMDVPPNQSFALWLYSQKWKVGDKERVAIKDDVRGPAEKCGTNFLFWPKIDSEPKENYKVCAHGPDKSQNYAPKETFDLPGQASDLETFRSKNTEVKIEVSLGPCQDEEGVVKAVESGQAPSKGVSKDKTAPAMNYFQPSPQDITAPNPAEGQ